MAEFSYFHLLYDAWIEAMAQGRPNGLEYRTLIRLCHETEEGQRFAVHKLQSDPEFNGDAIQLVSLGGCPTPSDEELRAELRSEWDKFNAAAGKNAKIVAIAGLIGSGKTYTAKRISEWAFCLGFKCTIASFGSKLKQFCSEYLEMRPTDSGEWEVQQCFLADAQHKFYHCKIEVATCVDEWVRLGRVNLAPEKYIKESCLRIEEGVSVRMIRDHLKRNLSTALGHHIERKSQLTARRVLQIVASVFRDLCGDDFWVNQMAQNLTASPDENRLLIIDDLRFHNEAMWVKRNGGYIMFVDHPGSEPLDSAARVHVSEHSVDEKYADVVLRNNHAGVDNHFVEALYNVKMQYLLAQ